MSYQISPTPHATLSSAVTQTVASTTTAYPLAFESTDDIQGLYRRSGTITVDIATPATVSWAGHGLAIGTPIAFTTTGALPTGITAGTIYYIISTGFTANAFQISTTFGGTAVNTSGTQSGVHTCTCISRIYAYESGDYLFTLSAIQSSTSNTASTMDVWFVQGTSTDTANNTGGTNVPKSDTQIANNSTQQQYTLAVSIILDLAKDDFVRLEYRGSNTNQQFLAVAAASSPTRPACPSVILTVNKTGR